MSKLILMNLNSKLLQNNTKVFNNLNRAFKYGDALFETIKVINLKIVFLEDHYFRLMASMRMLRMEIPLNFSLEFFEEEIIKTVSDSNFQNARVRITIYRKNGGLYLPKENSINYLIEVNELNTTPISNYEIDIFKDYFISSGLLSTIKTTNKLTNVLASIYASENKLNNCILINEKKNVVEAINGNIFIVSNNTIKTPPISDGCVKGIIRKKIIEIVNNSEKYNLEEVQISPFDLLKADEIFITNSIVEIQSVTKYKKNNLSTEVATEIAKELTKLV
jgi:branched-chain amino acid aminotransferase